MIFNAHAIISFGFLFLFLLLDEVAKKKSKNKIIEYKNIIKQSILRLYCFQLNKNNSLTYFVFLNKTP